MTIIFMQRGATSWGFQIGRLYLYVNYPRFWCAGLFKLGWDHEEDDE